MKLKYFIIALVAMLSCFTSKALAQEVILVHNAQELKQALMMCSSAESSAARRMAAATADSYPGTVLQLDGYTDATNIGGMFQFFNPLVLDLNGCFVNGDLTLSRGQLSIIDSKGTGAYIGTITTNPGAVLAIGSGNIISDDGAAIDNGGVLTIDGGAVIGKITDSGGTINKNADYNMALLADVATMQKALNVAIDGQGVKFAQDIEGNLTVPANVTLNGNGFAISGGITAGGEIITFAGVTKATSFNVENVNTVNTVVNIPAGASLQLTGNDRMVIGHGCTFNITGSIADNAAKTTDKATLTPSLVMPGASFTGAGVTFNVTNAYISVPSSYCSTSKTASGTFDFNITNSIWESAGKLAFEEQSVNAKVDFALVNSVLTTGSHLVFGTASGEEGVVIDNSLVNQGTSRQLENCGTMTVKNGSVVNGAVATSSNAKNPGTVIVENATYAVTGEFSGSDLGTGTLIIKKGATVSAGSITKANITVDAEGMAAGDEINLTANLSNLTGTLSVINNDKLEAKIVDGKVVLAAKPVAKIGEQGYATLDEAVKAAQEGDKITLLADAELLFENKNPYEPANNVFASEIDLNGKTMTIKKGDVRFSNTTIKNGNIVVEPKTYNGTAIFLMYSKNLTFDGVKVTATGVASTYLIGLEGTSNLDLLNGSEIVINNESLVNIGSIIADNGEGNTVTIKDSKIDITNSNARLYLGGTNGNITVENSDIDLNGVKEGFYLRAGQTLAITGTSTVDITLNSTEGRYGINLTDLTATYTKAETATVNATVYEIKVAKVGDVEFKTLQEAVDAVKEGETITLIYNVVLAERVTIPANKTLTIDLNGKSISMEESIIATAYAINNLGNLTIKDSVGGGSVNSRGMYNGYGDGGDNVASATITILGGTFNAKGTNGGAAIYNYGTANVNGGNFTSIGGYSLNNQAGASMTIADGVTANNGIYASNATLVVNGGEINGNRSGCHVLYSWNSAVTINGGTFYNYNSGNSTIMAAGTTKLTIKDGTFGIKDGRVPGDGNIWTSCLTDTQNSAEMTVNGGTFNGGFRVQAGTSMTINGGSFNDVYGSKYAIYGTAVVKGGTFTDAAAKAFATKYVSDDCTLGEEGKVVSVVAKIGDTKYETLEAAFAAATEGQTITMLDDATPALTSQRAITKAAVIDLGGKTMTLTEDDLYFGTTTFKNGTIVVDPSVKPSTAVFWMFANQTLTFDNVKIVATGVTGTYLIGLEGENSDLNLLNGSEILVENTTALDLDIICVNGTNTCDIKVENSKVNVTNIDGRVFFRGNYTVKDSEVNLAGITKAGFRIEAGQTLSIEGASKVNIEGELRDGGIHMTDLSATYTKAENATVNATVNEPKVAKVGENTYRTLAQAVAAVEDGGTITLIANETFTKNNRYNNGGWWDGLGYSGDKSFTIDLAGFTISQDGSLNDYLLWFKNAGSKENTITIKNGTLDAGTTAYCALCTASSHDNKLTINTEALTLINNISNGSTVRVRAGSVLNVKEGTKITGKNSYLGIECAASIVNIYDGAEIYMNGTASYNGCLVGACYGGTVNVYGGYGKGVKGGFIAMTSGGTINVAGGEWIANTDGTVGNNSNLYVLTAQSNKKESGFVGASIINVTGGTLRGGMDAWVLNNLEGEKAELNISGGNFNANPSRYVAENCIATENNGVWTVAKAAAKVGNELYASLEAAFKAATEGCTIEILSDVTVDYAWDARYTGGKFTVPVTINGNGKTIKFAASVNDNNYQAPFRFEADATVKNLTIDMSEVTDNRFRAISSKGNLTVDGCKFIGKDETLNCRAIIFGEGAGANVGNLAISITNSEFINWKRGITDNENAQDVKTVTITGNKLTDAGVGVSAKETVTFTGNTVAGAYVNIKSYTASNSLNVVATDNTLEENTETAYNVINAGGTINAQDGFKASLVANIGEATYGSLQAAVNAVKNGETITLVADIEENVTLTEKTGLYYTIDGDGKTMTGTITVSSLSDTNDNRRITIKNINFVDTVNGRDFITSTATNHYPRITVEGCSFTGTGKEAANSVAVRLKSSHSVVIKDCTGTGLHSFLQNTSGWNLTIDNVKVTDSKSGLALGTVQGVTVKGCEIAAEGYGIRLDAGYNNNAVIESNKVESFIPVVVRKATVESNIAIKGENEFTATNEDGLWMAVGTSEYEENGKMPTAATGKVVVTLNDANLSNEGIYGDYVVLAGKGTEAEPYLINNIKELVAFRNSVNGGETRYSAPGVWVVLAADIDMAGENWVGIGTATAEHGFMGNFDGKNFKFKNLTITNPALDSDGYAYAGLFGVTEGTDKDNQNTIKNLTIENVTITTTGHIASAAIAYPYYTIVDNVKVCGDIKIQGGNYTAGVLAYTRRCVNASNLSIVGNEGSFVKGNQVVGGVISDIQMNGGLVAEYSNFSAEGVTVTGTKNVGGISGIIATQTLNGAVVKNVTLNSDNAQVGIVAGCLGGTSTISNVTYENVAGATTLLGATYEGGAITAKIGDTYYATFENAYKAAQEGETITMLAPVVIASGETLTLDKNVTVAYTSNVAGEDMFTNRGTLNISAGTITYANTDATASNVTVSTISSEPGSVLNITGGTVENKTVKADGSSIYSFAIDMLTNGNLGDVTATINGGTVSSDYMAIRQFNNGTACKNTLNITGGHIYGAKRAVQVHIDNNAAYTTISGGKVEAGADGYAICNFAATGNLEVTGGEFIGAVYSALENFISGGTYNSPVEATYCAAGYMPNKNADGTYGVVLAQDVVASIDGVTYGSLKAAVAAAKAGETITLLQDVKENVTISKHLTIDGAGKTITGMITTDGKSLKVTIKKVNFNGNNKAIYYAVKADYDLNLVVENCSVDSYSYGFLYANKSNDKIVVKDVTVENCASYGAYLVSFNSATFENFTVSGAQYGVAVSNAAARKVSFKNVSFDVTGTPLYINEQGTGNVTFNFSGINDMGKAPYYTSQYVKVVAAAQVGTKVCGSLQDAVVAAEDGETVKVLSDLNMTTANFVTQVDGYATLVNVAGKAVTIDLNGKTVTVNAAHADLNGKAKGNMLMSVFHADPKGTLTLTDSSAEGTGTVELFANDATVYGLIVSENAYDKSNPGRIIVNGGNYVADKLSDSMIFADINEVITVNGGNFHLGNVGAGTNGKPWIFNTTGNNSIHINVNGGTYNANVAKQYWSYEVKIGSGFTVRDNGDGTWSVVTGITLVDGEFTEYTNNETKEVEYISYTRNNIPTTWTPIYLPFEVPVSVLAEQGFDVAYINGVRRDDTNYDGELDDFVMEIIYIHCQRTIGGNKINIDGSAKTLKANYPYFVRSTVDKELNIELDYVILYAAQNKSYECTTMTESFRITGNSSSVVVKYSDENRAYGVDSGEWKYSTSGAKLNPFRFYMTVTSRDGSEPVESAASSVRIVVRGHENEDGTTTIYDVVGTKQNSDVIYDIHGRRVLNPVKGSVYIVNGKKVIF